MDQSSYMPIREFSRLSGIKRENLRFYDQIGLLSPVRRGENGYRYYAWNQLESAFLISDLRAIGVGLEEIKQYSKERSPEKMFQLFADQDSRILAEIDRLNTIRELMQIRAEMVMQALKHQKDDLFVEEKKQEPIFLTPAFENCAETNDAILTAYDFAIEHGVNPNYPFGYVTPQSGLGANTRPPARQYYFKTKKAHNAHKPAGAYAVAYGTCEYGQSDKIYFRLLSFVQEQNLQVTGCAYEEYPNELSSQKGRPYIVRAEIPVNRP